MSSSTSIYEAFRLSVDRHPDKVLFAPPAGDPVTFADTLAVSLRIAARLHAAGLRPGDRVAVQVEKSPDAIALYLATLQLGGVFLPLNTAYTSAELDYFLQDSTPKVLVVDPAALDDHGHRQSDELTVETLGVDGDGTLLESDESHYNRHESRPEDPAAILYTSGTTGRSKGAILTHENLASNCVSLIESWEFTGDDRLIHALPIFHIHGLFVACNMALAAGATLVWLPKFDAESVLDLLPESTVLMGVPTFYTRLSASARLTPELCSNMRLFVSGSAPLLASDHEAFERASGHAILERYGMTETGMNASNPYRGGPRKPGTVGPPLPGVEIRVVDRETGDPVPDGEVGDIEVRGPNVFAGYWNMPEKTASEFRGDGFFVTGDLGRFDDDGYLCIVGRGKDMIISGGLNIYPKELEELLDEHDDVLESAVVGVPHPDLGETPLAVIVAEPGHTVVVDDLADRLASDLARFKHPRAYEIVQSLPRNVMGKVQKAELRQTYANTFRDESEHGE